MFSVCVYLESNLKINRKPNDKLFLFSKVCIGTDSGNFQIDKIRGTRPVALSVMNS